MHAFTSPRVRVLAAFTATLAAASAAGFLVVWQLHREVAEQAAFESARRARQMYDEFGRNDTAKLYAALQGLLANGELRRAFVEGDRTELQRLAAPILKRLEKAGITHWYFITPDRKVFLRVHKPGKHGDLVERVTLQRAAETGLPASGKELGRTAFALRVVSPWLDERGRTIGYVELGEEIGRFLTQMKEASGDEFGLVVKKEFLDEKAWAEVLGRARNTWNDRPGIVLVDTTSFAQGIADFAGNIDDVPDRGLLLETREERKGAWVRALFPVHDASGRTVGGLFILHDFSAEHAAFAAGRTRGVFVVLGVCVLGFALVAMMLRAPIAKPYVIRRARAPRPARTGFHAVVAANGDAMVDRGQGHGGNSRPTLTNWDRGRVG